MYNITHNKYDSQNLQDVATLPTVLDELSPDTHDARWDYFLERTLGSAAIIARMRRSHMV